MPRLQPLQDRFKRLAIRAVNRSAFEEDFLRTVPDGLKPAAEFAFRDKATPEEKAVARSIEQLRSKVAARDEAIESFASPRSGTFTSQEGGGVSTGPVSSSPASAHAKTGVSMKGGILLRRIVTGLAAKRILELGTNTGLSACYFLSSPVKPEVVTIEGSAALCAIAEGNLRQFSDSFTVMNRLFDEALDELTGKGERFDCAFIDGQHERDATWYYARKMAPMLKPGGAIIFDDIYWSDDMNQFWKEACLSDEFSVTIDLGAKGVGLLRRSDEPRMHYDVCEYSGRPRIFRKGW